MMFKEAYGLKITVFRPFNVYGSRQRSDQYGGVIASFIQRLRMRKVPVIYGDGKQTRDFIHVNDVVRSFLSALNHDGAADRVFNVAFGVPVTINQLARLVIKLYGADGVKPQHLDAREGEIRHSYADIREAVKHLGFKPVVSLTEGLLALIRRLESGKILGKILYGKRD